ncbi:MAG: hypothetical protein RsTaC01_0532 [Candidatus Paraimprobicoccus trichonymphae]|uniref:Uncharacterized protein n=1 Tax=Candidatus Paraimprobicoccus trichonymphae TaxID=3033793 RepID=A0AA48I4B9_9FIRM|nr:MAG: hypothetical protein RsTaC01_0532 [Candidatus Paraimprobicoccus trichonymphae]
MYEHPEGDIKSWTKTYEYFSKTNFCKHKKNPEPTVILNFPFGAESQIQLAAKLFMAMDYAEIRQEYSNYIKQNREREELVLRRIESTREMKAQHEYVERLAQERANETDSTSEESESYHGYVQNQSFTLEKAAKPKPEPKPKAESGKIEPCFGANPHNSYQFKNNKLEPYTGANPKNSYKITGDVPISVLMFF